MVSHMTVPEDWLDSQWFVYKLTWNGSCGAWLRFCVEKSDLVVARIGYTAREKFGDECDQWWSSSVSGSELQFWVICDGYKGRLKAKLGSSLVGSV